MIVCSATAVDSVGASVKRISENEMKICIGKQAFTGSRIVCVKPESL